MKNSRNILFILIAIVVVILVGLYLYNKNSQKNSHLVQQKNAQNSQINDTNHGSNNADTDNTGSTSAMNNQLPKWAQSLIEINENTAYSREDKIEKLIQLLKENDSNPQALNDILVSLTSLNPIEAADEIIPYLKNSSPRVQSAALGALNNASLLTPKEHELKRSLSENDEKRKQISEAVNELKNDPNISKEVRQALISNYTATNPSPEDTKRLKQEIIQQKEITPNEASYVASTILNGKDLSETLKSLDAKDAVIKDSIISSIGANIIENPNVANVLSSEQKTQLATFIQKNPPSSAGADFGYQNDQWKNTLNILSNNN